MKLKTIYWMTPWCAFICAMLGLYFIHAGAWPQVIWAAALVAWAMFLFRVAALRLYGDESRE